MKLAPEQARQLFDAGGFILLAGLPEGAEVGLDGDVHVVRRFSGYKMIPPGLHLLTWGTNTATAGPNAVQHGIWCCTQARRSLSIKYEAARDDVEAAITEAATGEMQHQELDLDHLRSLDAELAPYPFNQYQSWKDLTECIGGSDVQRIIGSHGKIDSLSESPADREVASAAPETVDERFDTLKFTAFDLKRSWRSGAVGEEITRFHKDKSWLWCDVVSRLFGGKPEGLLTELQLAFITFLHLHNFSCLLVYKRFLSLCCRASNLTSRSTDVLADSLAEGGQIRPTTVNQFFTSFIRVVRAQLAALPDAFFSVDLEGTGLEQYFIEELTALASGLGGISSPASDKAGSWQAEYTGLVSLTSRRFGWSLPSLDEAAQANARDEEDEDDEEGEYAPAIVDV